MQGGREYGWWQIFLMAFTTTLREGLESVVFLAGVSAGVDPRSIPIAGIVGIILGIIVGVILYYTWVSSPCTGFLASNMTRRLRHRA
jgi:high-affinity iron transporter